MRLEAVAEIYQPSQELAPWPVADGEVFFYLPLNDSTPAPAIGSIVYALFPDYEDDDDNRPKFPLTPATVFETILREYHEQEGMMTLAGGLRLSDGKEKVIRPSCCCGLEDWRPWFDIFSGQAPWWGHSPDPHVEILPEGIRAYSRGGMDKVEDYTSVIKIEMSFDELSSALQVVEKDLHAFLPKLEAWACALEPALGLQLVECFDQAFNITKDFRKR